MLLNFASKQKTDALVTLSNFRDVFTLPLGYNAFK